MAEHTKYVVSHVEGYGRCLKAARDIKAGELIFKEEALCIGPLHDSKPLCLGCLKPLTKVKIVN